MVFGWFFEGKKKNKQKQNLPLRRLGRSRRSCFSFSLSLSLLSKREFRACWCASAAFLCLLFFVTSLFFFFSFPLANTFFSLYFSRNPQIDFELNTIKFKKKRVGGAISLRELDLIFVFWLVPRPHSSSISSPTHSSFIIIIFFLFFKKKKKCLPYSSSNNRKVGNCS